MVLAVQHCIWNINPESFDSLSLAFASGLQTALKDELDEETKNAWVSLLTAIGTQITDRYER